MNKRQRDRYIYSILLIICIIGFWVFENFYTPDVYSSKADDADKTPIPSFFIPSSTGGQLAVHDHFQLSYRESFEQAEWVIYTLKKSHLTNDDRQRPYFVEDPYLHTKSADWRNYKGSGFDRGHLCPAGDRRFSQLAYRETFYTSNISPQDPEFNAGIWNELEQQIRIWSRRHKELYIATAGVLEPGLYTIGEEDVAIPEQYYKIVARGSGKNLKVIAFLMPNRPSTDLPENYIVTVDRIEELTGIDFFESLPQDLEKRMEAEIVKKNWRFTTIR